MPMDEGISPKLLDDPGAGVRAKTRYCTELISNEIGGGSVLVSIRMIFGRGMF